MSVASCLHVLSSLWLCVHYIIPGAAGPLLWGEPQDVLWQCALPAECSVCGASSSGHEGHSAHIV